MKTIIGKQSGKLISSYETLLNRTEFIPSQSNYNNPIQTIVKILETLMIKDTGDLNWFNGLIINIPIYTRSIIKVSFPPKFRQYLTEMKNKIKQLLAIYKFERFFEKIYKIRAAVVLPELSKLIHNDPLLDLTSIQFYRNG